MTTAATTIVEVAWRRVRAGDRTAVIVLVTTARGAVGVGEACPLPGRSSDDVDAAVRAMAALAARVPIELDRAGFAAAVALAASITSAPAARFAIETAVLDAAARDRGATVAELIAPDPAIAVSINAVVGDPAGARRAVERGITTVKVKLGADEHARTRLASIRAAIGPGVALRADVNRGWSTAIAIARLRELRDLGLEYVEEPCPDTSSIAAASPVPLALDETVAELDDAAIEAVLARRGVAVAVIKPGMVGGLGRACWLAARAAAARVDVVVTHALEGPIATAACAELARALRCRRAVGLDQHPGLAAWRRTRVPQLGRSTVIAPMHPGLGLDLAAVLADVEDLDRAGATLVDGGDTVPRQPRGSPRCVTERGQR